MTKPTFPSPSACSVSTYVAILESHDRRKQKAVVVPVGQSLDFDEGPSATRRWLHPHLDSEWHLKEFLPLTAAPAPVLVIELDQKENSTRMEGSVANASVLLSLAQELSEALISLRPLGGSECLSRHYISGKEFYFADTNFFRRAIQEMRENALAGEIARVKRVKAETRRTAPDDPRLVNCISSDPSPAVLVNEELVRALTELGPLPWRIEPHRSNPYNCHVVDAEGDNVIMNVGKAFGEFCVAASHAKPSP